MSDIFDDRLRQLAALFPEAFADGVLDLDGLRASLGLAAPSGPERFSFTWAGKQASLQLLQSPSRATLVPASEISSPSDGVFIAGDNLEVLRLLYKPYFGRVRLIYIDPPYNTGSDFVYRDNYADPLDAYLRLTGQADAAGNWLTSNPETGGRFHSAWLSMMYPRLFVARQLLRDDGVICVSIDDHELPHLRLLMNEIFGETCFKNTIIVRRGVKSVQAQFENVDALAVGHEYIVVYAKSPEARFRHLRLPLDEPKPGGWNNHWRGTERPTMRYELFGITPDRGQWRWSHARSLRAVEAYRRLAADLGPNPSQAEIDEWWRAEGARLGGEVDLLRLSKTGKPEHYVPPTETRLGSDLWADLSPRGNADLEALLGQKVFDNPKPVALIRRLVEWITGPQGGDLVLDFFAGSCATAQAVMEANADDGGDRRWIMVQIPEPLRSPVLLPHPQPISQGEREEDELQTIADIGLARIRAVIERMENPAGVRVFRLAASHFREWQPPEDGDPARYAESLAKAVDPLLPGWTDAGVLYEVALREGLGLDLQIETIPLPGQPDSPLYRIVDRQQVFYLSLADDLTGVAGLETLIPPGARFICRDAALDDTTAARLALYCRLKTI